MNSSSSPKQRDDFGACDNFDNDQGRSSRCMNCFRLEVEHRPRKKHTERNQKAIEALNVIPPERLRVLAYTFEQIRPVLPQLFGDEGVVLDDAVERDLRKMADLSEQALQEEAKHES